MIRRPLSSDRLSILLATHNDQAARLPASNSNYSLQSAIASNDAIVVAQYTFCWIDCDVTWTVMALISYMLGSARSSPNYKHQRKRLHKTPPKAKSPESLYSCKELLAVIGAQSCLVVSKSDENSSVTEVKESEEEKAANSRHIGFPFENSQLDSSEDLFSNYAAEEMDPEHLKRTRAKTPVFSIGQLERSSMPPTDKAQTLAEQYQSLLPPRTFTPYLLDIPELTPKKLQKLRKIKCQLSLRDAIKEQSNRGHSVAYSDAETLVGSESPTSLHFPTDGEFEKGKLPIINPHEKAPSGPMTASDDDIGLKICVDLLTNELATALFRQHPAEHTDRASGLQVLLMIEAYEAIQKNVRQQLCDPHVTQEMKDHVKSVDKILRYWLKVLYSVYDHSQERKLQKADGEQWPLDNSPDEIHSASDKCPR
jgi:hypothetical protein